MNISPVSFGMSAIFTDKGMKQLIKASANASPERSSNFVKSAENFSRNLANTKYVDVVVDKTGILFPRLKADVVIKDAQNHRVISTVKQPRLSKVSTKVFDVSTQNAVNAENVISASQNFNLSGK